MNLIIRFLLKISQGKALQSYEEVLPSFKPQVGIPKMIFQTNRTKNVTKEIEENIRNIKGLNPNWKYQLYDDNDIENYIKNNYGDMIWTYYSRIDSQYGAAKADFFRYLLIYKEGGIYMDLKSSAARPLDDLLYSDDQYILSYWDNGKGERHEGFGKHYNELRHIEKGEYMQWYIIASPGHPFLRAVILRVMKNIDLYNPYMQRVGHDGVFYTTGPNVYTLAIEQELMKNNMKNQNYRWVDLFKDFGFKYSIYELEGSQVPIHSKIFKNYYGNSWKPVIKHKNKIIQMMNTSIFFIYSIYLKSLKHYKK